MGMSGLSSAEQFHIVEDEGFAIDRSQTGARGIGFDAVEAEDAAGVLHRILRGGEVGSLVSICETGAASVWFMGG